MSGWYAAGRTVLGVLTIVTILALTVADAAFDAVSVANGRLFLLIVLAGSLLGFDILLEHLPVSITVRDESDDDRRRRK